MAARNFHLVPDDDKPYFVQATVRGIQQQLAALGLDTSRGLKYDLYLRLRNEGHRLYTDDRVSSEDDSSGDGQSEDDQSGDEEPGDGQSGDDQSGEDSSGDDHSGDDHLGDDQGGDPPRGGGKRRRDDDDDGHNDNDQGSAPPAPPAPSPPRPRKGLRIGPLPPLPIEIQLQIVDNLNADQIWNLATAAPGGYLSNDLNVFILEARRQHAIDYPPGIGDDDGGSDGGGSDGDSSGSSDDLPDPDRRLSLLQWVGRRCIYDSAFRRERRAEIMQVVDAYLQEYGNADPAPGHNTEIEQMLWYFRHSPPQDHVLLTAARNERPDIVHLLLLRGAIVDQTIPFPPITPLSAAVEELDWSRHVSRNMNLLQCIFALIGAGADVTAVRGAGQLQAGFFLGEFIDLPDPGAGANFRWRRIINFRQVSAREFVADERSDWFERIIVAVYIVWRGTMSYPGFEF